MESENDSTAMRVGISDNDATEEVPQVRRDRSGSMMQMF